MTSTAVTVGPSPDSLAFTPDGHTLVVACEGVPSDNGSIDPPGGVALIDVSSGPQNVTASDVELLGFAIQLELTARDLYDAAIEAGATGSIWTALREQHEAYAQLLSGIAGLPADTRHDATYEALVGRFTSTTSEAGLGLGNVAAATHAELLAVLEDSTAAAGVASISAMESRHATVLAGLARKGDDLDALFLNTADPLAPEA